MTRSFQHHPLPVKIPLSGIKRFPEPLDGPPRTWHVKTAGDHFPSLELETSGLLFQGGLGILPGFQEGNLTRIEPAVRGDPSFLIDSDWDWVEYCFQPLGDLLVQAVLWSPDVRVICGSYHLINQASGARKIAVLFQYQSQDRSALGGLTPNHFQGRTVLSGLFGSTWAGLLLAEGQLVGNGVPTLAARATLQGGGQNEIRWVSAYGRSRAEVEEHLDRALRLDWEGELAHKKVAHESRLRIETGDPGRDLLLASNQNMSRRIFENLALEAPETKNTAPFLSTLQAWQLYQSLYPLSTSDLGRFLNLVFQGCELPAEDRQATPIKQLELPLKAALLWQVSRGGHPPGIWEDYLDIIEADLESWFDPDLDRDGDGIPAIHYPGPFRVDSQSQEPIQAAAPDHTAGLLEHPGLAALLANEINLLAFLRESAGRDPLPAIWEARRERLSEFIRGSWQPAENRFQSREAETHTTCQGSVLTPALPNGFHSLQIELPLPSRITVQYQDLTRSLGLPQTRVILHGMDWKGNYRVEEANHPLIDWERKQGTAGTNTVYARLDNISISGLDPSSQVVLQVPTTDPVDIHHLLPFWHPTLDGEKLPGQGAFPANCLEELRSDLGLRSFPGEGPIPVQLVWNILAVRGLLQMGQSALAERICSSWLRALEVNFRSNASHLSGWDSMSGSSWGKKDSIESSFPIQLLLELAGLSLRTDGSLLYEPRDSTCRILRLVFQGIEISLSPDQLRVRRPGDDPVHLSRDGRQVIQLRTSSSVNIST